ncbi:hypothetical protein Tco_0474984 [Tanacetum coccineum]
MEQYLALTRGNQAPGVVKPEIGGNVNFEIKSQFMRELKEDTFSGNKNNDAHEHVERVLDIIGLFNIPRVSHDAFMLRVFPITLTGATKIWVDILSPGIVDSRDLLKKPLSKGTARHPKPLRSLTKSTTSSRKEVNIFYNGFSTMNHQLLDSQGPISGMTLAQALMVIQTMVDHSQKWHDGSSSRNIDSSSNSKGITAIVNKLDSLGRDMKKLKENVHAIQVGCQTYEGSLLDKECPLNEEVKSIEEVIYGEFGRPFCWLVPSRYVIFDLEPLSLSFDFVFMSEIFKSLSFSLDCLCRLAILCLDQHAHTLHHLESLLIISLDRLDILKEDLVYQSLRKSLSLILKLS